MYVLLLIVWGGQMEILVFTLEHKSLRELHPPATVTVLAVINRDTFKVARYWHDIV